MPFDEHTLVFKVNTESENFSVQFFVSAVPSQTVDLIPQTSLTGAADDRQTRIALAAPLLKLESGDFVFLSSGEPGFQRRFSIPLYNDLRCHALKWNRGGQP